MSQKSYISSLAGLLLLFTAALGFVAIPLRQFAGPAEPLADPSSLRLLTQGLKLPKPAEPSEATFHDASVTAPKLATRTQVAKALGVATPSDKRIEVDLTNQKVYAFEGNVKVYEFLISSGKWGRTPTGEFTIWAKVKTQLMSGGNKRLHTYYYLPNVPWVMFFYNSQIPKMRGFSFHGTYWHDKFGTPQSHGCINMKTEEAKILYDWAAPVVTDPKAWSTLSKNDNPGTRVIIYGEAPTTEGS